MRGQQAAGAQTAASTGVAVGAAASPTTSAKTSLLPASRANAVSAGGSTENRPRVGAIWAQDAQGIIGDGRRMLWRVPADFRHFKETTWGCPVVMGRKSWEALPGALPGRQNLVITRKPGYVAPGAIVVGSLEEALQVATSFTSADGASNSPTSTALDSPANASVDASSDTSLDASSSASLAAPSSASQGTSAAPHIWIVGGAQVYAQALPLVDELVITYLDLDVRDSAAMSAETAANKPDESAKRLLAYMPTKLAKQLEDPANRPVELAELAVAPPIDPALWDPSPAAPEAVPWREKSGDARWKVVTWRRRT